MLFVRPKNLQKFPTQRKSLPNSGVEKIFGESFEFTYIYHKKFEYLTCARSRIFQIFYAKQVFLVSNVALKRTVGVRLHVWLKACGDKGLQFDSKIIQVVKLEVLQFFHLEILVSNESKVKFFRIARYLEFLHPCVVVH